MSSAFQDREGNKSYRAPRLQLSLKDFDLLAHIGEGSYSQVLHARHLASDTECALKVIDKHLILRNKQWAQVRTERNVLDRLRHGGVVQLLFSFQCPDSLYLGLEYCPQGELFEQITERKRLSLDQARFYAAEIADILAYLQSEQVVHRDLKPENLLLTADGHLKLADFGSAKDLSDTETASAPDGMRANILAGTADYIAPEVLRNEVVTCAADLWALGCLIFQMLAGQPPFRDKTEYLTLERVSAGMYTAPEDFPVDALDLVQQLLVLEPTRRLGLGPDGMQQLKRHSFFSGVQWEGLRTQRAPAWLPREALAHLEDEGLNWELTSLLAALPLHVEPADAGTPAHGASADAVGTAAKLPEVAGPARAGRLQAEPSGAALKAVQDGELVGAINQHGQGHYVKRPLRDPESLIPDPESLIPDPESLVMDPDTLVL